MEQRLDLDRDGVTEFRGLYSAHDPRYAHAVPDEAWEDWDGDGGFEKHYWISGPGKVDPLELDTNGDGDYDTFLVGDKANKYLEDNPWPVA